jgi:hypothetical protein
MLLARKFSSPKPDIKYERASFLKILQVFDASCLEGLDTVDIMPLMIVAWPSWEDRMNNDCRIIIII